MRDRDGSVGGTRRGSGKYETGQREEVREMRKKVQKMPNSSEVLGDKIRFFTKKSHVLLHI